MPYIEIYTKSWCPYCHKAKALLRARGLPFDEIDVTTDGVREGEMIERSGRHTVPEIFFDGRLIGGHDDIVRLDASGGLGATRRAVLSRRQGASSPLPDALASRRTAFLPCRRDSTAQTVVVVRNAG